MKMSLSNWSLRNRLLLATVTIAAIGIGASDFAANTALRSYLIKQVDIQLQSITDNSLARLDRAGIDSITQSDEQQIFRPVRPLRNVPTATVVTLLDLKGNT
jgi:two-component system, OmpR family, sensor kinase